MGAQETERELALDFGVCQEAHGEYQSWMFDHIEQYFEVRLLALLDVAYVLGRSTTYIRLWQ